jgi:hypothetical protein
MPIVNSTILSAVPQVDGRISVHEQHTDHNGKTYDVVYLADPDMDINAVLMARAENIGKEIDARAAIEAEAQNFEIPMTERQFLRRFTVAERVAIRNAAETDPVIADFLDFLSKPGGVYRKPPLGELTVQGLNYLVSVGLLQASRIPEILAP